MNRQRGDSEIPAQTIPRAYLRDRSFQFPTEKGTPYTKVHTVGPQVCKCLMRGGTYYFFFLFRSMYLGTILDKEVKLSFYPYNYIYTTNRRQFCTNVVRDLLRRRPPRLLFCTPMHESKRMAQCHALHEHRRGRRR